VRLEADLWQVLRLLHDLKVEGRSVTLRSGRLVYRWVHPPLVIFYQRRGRDLVLVRVRHGAQRPLTEA
jgi:plasmid stabilization system protein ParE